MPHERRLIAHATSAGVRAWIEAEVGDVIASRHYATTVSELVAALGRGAASAHDLLILDLDSLSVTDAADLHTEVESRWWSGTIVGLGKPRHRHRRALEIAHTIPRPFGSEALREIATRTGRRDTQPLLRVRS